MDLGENTFMNTLVQEMTRDLIKKKEKIIFDKLKEKGIDLDLKKERNRRFKQLQVDVVGVEEHYYYNDGSDEGLRIVTFKQLVPKIGIPDQPMVDLNVQLEYY